jgi:site-specific DNA recombinase
MDSTADGWTALPVSYDDGGYSGASTNRPAFQRLIRDVEAGEIDVLCVYKLDRLSRSQLDFMHTMDFFEKNGVQFASITESFDTSTMVGRLVLSILAIFAQFERERSAERTRDKLRAATAKGMWTGGFPVLGYDVVDKKLVTNEKEAEQVRVIFAIYLEIASMMGVVSELNRRGWKTKTYKTKGGKVRPGKDFTFGAVRSMLQRQVYIGLVESRGEVYPGQHDAIIDKATWDAVQALIKGNTRNGGSFQRHRPPARMLSGLLFCGVCGSGMIHEQASSGGTTRKYRYYRCGQTAKKGTTACPSSRVPAGQIEQFIVDRIREIGTNPQVFRETLVAGKAQLKARKPAIQSELRRLGRDRKRLHEKARKMVAAVGEGQAPKSLVTEIGNVEASIEQITSDEKVFREELKNLESRTLDRASLKQALESFDGIWAELFPEEQSRVIHLLVEKVICNVPEGIMDVTFRPGGIKAFAKERSSDDDGEVSGKVRA